MLLTCLLRRSLLTLNTDLSKLAGEMRAAAPDYFLNVPALLERMRKAVDGRLWKTGGLALAIYSRAKAAWIRKRDGHPKVADRVWLSLAERIIFPTIRKKMIGSNLKALICGSAPLNVDTQLYFNMLGISVFQVYGLTETTAICTMDDPRHVEPGRVGPAISGIEMELGEDRDYCARAQHLSRILEPATGNRQVAPRGMVSHRRSGRSRYGRELAYHRGIKNLIILGSGHNIAPPSKMNCCDTCPAPSRQCSWVTGGDIFRRSRKHSREQVQQRWTR